MPPLQTDKRHPPLYIPLVKSLSMVLLLYISPFLVVATPPLCHLLSPRSEEVPTTVKGTLFSRIIDPTPYSVCDPSRFFFARSSDNVFNFPFWSFLPTHFLSARSFGFDFLDQLVQFRTRDRDERPTTCLRRFLACQNFPPPFLEPLTSYHL